MMYAITLLKNRLKEITAIMDSIPVWSKDFKLLQVKQKELDDAVRRLEMEFLVERKKDKMGDEKVWVHRVRVIRVGVKIYAKEYEQEMTLNEMRIIMKELATKYAVTMNCVGFDWHWLSKHKEG